jgi:hypothetical protein
VLIGSAAMLWGYIRNWLKESAALRDDIEFRHFLRSYQHACLWRGKRAGNESGQRRPAAALA